VTIPEVSSVTPTIWSVDGFGPAVTDHVDHLLLCHPSDHTKHRSLSQSEITDIEPLQVDVLVEGRLVYDLPSIDEIRQRRLADVRRLDPGVRRLMNPHIYHVSLTQQLWDLKQALIRSAMRKSH